VAPWIWLSDSSSFNAGVNLIGIQFTARVNRYMLAMELDAGLVRRVRFDALYGGAGAGRLTLRQSMIRRVFARDGRGRDLDCRAVLSGLRRHLDALRGNRGNRSAVGRATLLSLLLVGALFMLQTWIATDLARGMRFSARRKRRFTTSPSAPAAPGCGS
jgi:hypothetical protein